MKRKYVALTQKEWLAHEGVAKLGKGRISKLGHLYLNEAHRQGWVFADEDVPTIKFTPFK